MVSIITMQEWHIQALKALRVQRAQQRFVGTIDDLLQQVHERCSAHIITHEQTLVGFFLLDQDYPRQHRFCPAGGLGLRGFFIDRRQQRRGYAKSALLQLRAYVLAQLPTCRCVYLTVNCANSIAYHSYRQCGFEDSGQLNAGPEGPQHILYLNLRPQ